MSKTDKQAVLDCVKELQPCGFRIVSKTLEMDLDDVKQYLEDLQHDGFVKQKSNTHWVTVKTSKPAPNHAWRQYPEDDKPTAADMVASGLPKANEADVESAVRSLVAKWPSGNSFIELPNKTAVYRDQFQFKINDLKRVYDHTSGTTESFNQWLERTTNEKRKGFLKAAGQKEVQKSADETASKVMQQPRTGGAPRTVTVNAFSTDDLIKQVKQGEKAREELRRRVEGLL